jgi:hypothetical protein
MRKPIEQELRAPATPKLPTLGGVGQAGGQILMSPRERMWSAMIKLTNSKARRFTPNEISDLAHPVLVGSVIDYLEALAKAGLAERVQAQQGRAANGDFEATHWRLLVKWAQAPRINAKGMVVTQGLGVLAMWRAARIRKEFTPSELARDASVGAIKVSHDTARQYCLALERSGHFKFISKGRGGIESRFKLVNNTGPHAPAITRAKVVFDRNQGALLTIDTPQDVCDAIC